MCWALFFSLRTTTTHKCYDNHASLFWNEASIVTDIFLVGQLSTFPGLGFSALG